MQKNNIAQINSRGEHKHESKPYYVRVVGFSGVDYVSRDWTTSGIGRRFPADVDARIAYVKNLQRAIRPHRYIDHI